MKIRVLAAMMIGFLAVSASGQAPADFTGHWQQQTASGAQRRLDIEQNGRILLVKTVITNSLGTRHLEVKYEIGGPEVTYTGLDGDEFHSSVRWEGSTLIFDTVEHERGKEIPEKTLWILSEDRQTLQVDRQQSAENRKTTNSLTSYIRQH